jgi:hypothetical protein
MRNIELLKGEVDEIQDRKKPRINTRGMYVFVRSYMEMSGGTL